MSAPPFRGGPPWISNPDAPFYYWPPPGLENTQAAAQPSPYVRKVGVASFTSATSVGPFVASANVGDGLVVVVGHVTTRTVTLSDNYGSLYVRALSELYTNQYYIDIFYCPSLLGTNPAVTVTGSGTLGATNCSWLQVIGASQGWFLDALNSVPHAIANAFQPFVRTTSPNDLIISVYGGGSPTAPTFASGYTVYSFGTINTTNGGAIAYAKSPAANWTIAPGWTVTGGVQGTAATIAIRSALYSPDHTPLKGLRPPFLPPWMPSIDPPPFPAAAAPSTPSGALFGLAFAQSPVLGAMVGSGEFSGLASAQGPSLASLAGKGSLSGLATAQGPVLGMGLSVTAVAGLAFAVGVADAAVSGSGALAGDVFGMGPVKGALTGAGALSGLASSSAPTDARLTGSGSLAGVAFGAGPARGSLVGSAVLAGALMGFGPVFGTITTLAAGVVAGVAIGFGYSLAAITFSGTPIVQIPQVGGTGIGRQRKKASELFQEELAKLEKQYEAARAEKQAVEEQLSSVTPEAPLPESVMRFIVAHERAIERAQKRELAENIEIPVYVRIPRKSKGVERLEALERLRNLAHIARYREALALERVRKLRERIDTEAAVYLMHFLMWDE